MINKISIGFTGDFSFSGFFKGRHSDNMLLEKEILNFLNKNDVNIINFESPITPCRMTSKKRLTHRCEPEVLDYVQNHFKNPVLSLANNHMMDYGRTGMMDTLEVLNQRKISYIGAGSTVTEAARCLVFGDEVKVGVFAVQYKNYRIADERLSGPLHNTKIKQIQETISYLKDKVDYIVLVYHGGDEFLHAPMPYDRKLLKKYLNMGCDIVVAHHPHVVQGYEKFGKKMIFYSLGNFMFDTDYQRVQEDTDKGVLLNISFYKEDYKFEYLPIKIDREDQCVYVADDDIYFKDIKKEYGRLWAVEAARKKKVSYNAKVLKERELEEAIRTEIELKNRIDKILMKYEFIGDMEENDMTEYSDAGQIALKKTETLYKKIKRWSKKIVNPAYKKKVVIMYGTLKAKIFY